MSGVCQTCFHMWINGNPIYFKDSCLVFVIGAGVVFNVVVCLLLYRCLEVGFGVNALRCEQMFEVVVSVCNNAV